MAEADIAVLLMVRWLRANITGCAFARAFATEPHPDVASPTATPRTPGGISLTAIRSPFGDPPLGDLLQAQLNRAAENHAALLVIFPTLRYEEEIAKLARLLASHFAWRVWEPKWESEQRDDLLLALDWVTPTNHISNALGFAPSGSMPVTRRSPFVSMVIWPGGHENKFRNVTYKRVGVADMKHELSQATYDQYWSASEDNKARHTADEDVSAARHDVSFCLRSSVRSLVFPS